MGRPERTIDPQPNLVHQLAADLRELRRRAGSPTYRQLAERAHYSPSALSQAASGRRLPTLPILMAFVHSCGGDVETWIRRWHEASAAQDVDASAVATAEKREDNDSGSKPSEAQRGSYTTKALLFTPLAVLAVGMAVALVALLIRSPSAAAPSIGATGPSVAAGGQANPPAQPVADGSDPVRSGCVADAVTLDSTDLYFPPGRLAGTLELRFSSQCDVAWPTFFPAPTGRGLGDTVTLETYRPSDGAFLPFTISYRDEAVNGDILLVTEGCVAARASVLYNGQRSPAVSTHCSTGTYSISSA